MKSGEPSVAECDVLVAGGGVAGAAAAISAARRGCRVILVEQNDRLGGIGTQALLGTICGLYGTSEDLPTETLNRGMVREVVSGLHAQSPRRMVQKRGQVYVLPYADSDLAAVLDALCATEKNLTLLLRSRLVSASVRSQTVSELSLEGSTLLRVLPAVVIDATGNGEVGYLAGASFDLAPREQRQMAGYTVRVRGLDNPDGLGLKVPYVLAGLKGNAVSATLRFTAFTAGEEPDEGFLKFSSARPDGPEREQQMKADVAAAMEALVDRLPAFHKAYIVETAGTVIDREGRRLCGEYVLTEEDIVSGRKFDDGAVRNAWPIELWDRHKGTLYRYAPKGDYYEIPFRSLVVKGFANLLASGRCISASHEAFGSVRVMGCCMATGDAAGRAAAAFVKSGKYGNYRLNE